MWYKKYNLHPIVESIVKKLSYRKAIVYLMGKQVVSSCNFCLTPDEVREVWWASKEKY